MVTKDRPSGTKNIVDVEMPCLASPQFEVAEGLMEGEPDWLVRDV